jgi:hypothetical protein
MPYDYEQLANNIAGPDCQDAVRYVAKRLHDAELMHTHADIASTAPCSYCWIRAGKAIRALREFTGHPSVGQMLAVADFPQPPPPDNPWPLRVKLAHGRRVHAAQVNPMVHAGHDTLCGYYVHAQYNNHWLPGDTAVTCAPCNVQLRKEENNGYH